MVDGRWSARGRRCRCSGYFHAEETDAGCSFGFVSRAEISDGVGWRYVVVMVVVILEMQDPVRLQGWCNGSALQTWWR